MEFFIYMRRQLSILFKVKFLLPDKKPQPLSIKTSRPSIKKAQLAVSKRWLYFSCSSLGLFSVWWFLNYCSCHLTVRHQTLNSQKQNHPWKHWLHQDYAKGLLCFCIIYYFKSLVPVGTIKLHWLVMQILGQHQCTIYSPHHTNPSDTSCRITSTGQRCQLWEWFCNSSIWPLGTLIFELCQLGSCPKVHQMVRKLR